jgi:hypothetical protein
LLSTKTEMDKPVNSDILRTFMGLIKPWRQFWRMSRENGFLFALMTLLYKWVPEWLFHAKGFVIVRVEPHESLSSQADALSVRRATPDDLDLLSHCGYPQSILADWFDRGARAWLIERERRLLACYWLDGNDRYYLYDWLVIKSAPKDVWVLWWWVARSHRKQELAYQIRRLGVLEYARAGFTQILGAVDMLNHNALRGCEKMGSKAVGRLFIVRILGLTFVRFGRSLRVGRWGLGSVLELPKEELLWKENG